MRKKRNLPGKAKRRRQGDYGRRNVLFGKALFPLKLLICKPQRKESSLDPLAKDIFLWKFVVEKLFFYNLRERRNCKEYSKAAVCF